MSLREQKHLLKPQQAGWPSSAVGEPGQPCDQLKGPQREESIIWVRGDRKDEQWHQARHSQVMGFPLSEKSHCLLKLSCQLVSQVILPLHPQCTPDLQHASWYFLLFWRLGDFHTKVCSTSSLLTDWRNLKEIHNMFESQHLCLKGFLFHINTSTIQNLINSLLPSLTLTKQQH